MFDALMDLAIIHEAAERLRRAPEPAPEAATAPPEATEPARADDTPDAPPSGATGHTAAQRVTRVIGRSKGREPRTLRFPSSTALHPSDPEPA
jgi:hypothetical protein